jgi:hypothetical protein
MTATSVSPARPVNPLSYQGSRGEIRRVGLDDYLWDGHDWVLLPEKVAKDAAGSVQLANGLYVTGTGTAPNTNDALWVAGNAHVTSDITVDGRVFAADVRVNDPGSPGSTRFLGTTADRVWRVLPGGRDFTAVQTTNGSSATAESYAGVGVAWNYNAARRVKITCQSRIYVLSTTPAGALVETHARLRGGLGSAVNVSDLQLNETVVPAATGLSASHSFITEISPGKWADGVQVYVALWLTLGAAGSSWSYQRLADPTFPTLVRKEDDGI